jgi:23S rRNA (guanosine2251-2'-O)-methyltransferase
VSSSALTMQTKCPFGDCLTVFAIELAEDDPKATRSVPGNCSSCLRAASFKPLAVIEKLERNLGKRSEHLSENAGLSVILEDVRSLWNVGSIFRTADGAGFGTLFLSGITGCPPRKEIAKTSLGAEDYLDWQYFLSAVDIIPRLKSAGVLIVGLERNAESLDLNESIQSGKLKTPLCLIVGNEVTGLSIESLNMCDAVCHLPMHGFKESLNVAVAFGIASYSLSSAFRSDGIKNESRSVNSPSH